MRSAVVSCGLLAALVFAAPATASECPANPGALGTSRTIVVDPTQHSLLGGHQYRESLPLNDKEVVITFDDGPLPPYSTRILDILAHECVKATFFMVGRMARSFPQLVRRTYDEGHTLANHSQSHPFTFHRMTVDDAAREIEGGFQSIAAAVGDPAKVAPFFRFPGLLRQDSVEQYLRSRRVMAWSVDFMADDWTRINAREINRRALERLEAKGKGILLLHDIQPATALGLPDLLRELKARGYRVVHVVPASTARPATATTPDQWVVRHGGREQVAQGGAVSVWPRVLPYRAPMPAPMMQAPSVMSFGAETPDDDVPVALVSTPEALRSGDGNVALPPWPPEVITIAAFPQVDVLPAPDAGNFRYNRITRSRPKQGKRARPKRPAPQVTHSTNADVTGSINEAGGNRQPKAKSDKSGKSKSPAQAPNHTPNHTPNQAPKAASPKPRNAVRPRPNDPIGHQIRITQPQASLSPAR